MSYAQEMHSITEEYLNRIHAVDERLHTLEANKSKYSGSYYTAQKIELTKERNGIADEGKAALTEKRKAATARAEMSFAPNGKDLDPDAVNLLKSGIKLTDEEYTRIFDAASTPTMKRLIHEHADQAGKEIASPYHTLKDVQKGAEILANYCVGALYDPWRETFMDPSNYERVTPAALKDI